MPFLKNTLNLVMYYLLFIEISNASKLINLLRNSLSVYNILSKLATLLIAPFQPFLLYNVLLHMINYFFNQIFQIITNISIFIIKIYLGSKYMS